MGPTKIMLVHFSYLRRPHGVDGCNPVIFKGLKIAKTATLFA